MVRIDRVITRGGDGGETSLGDGARVPKHAPRIELLGALDEANAALGVLGACVEGNWKALVLRVQNDLFDMGADVCRPGIDGKRFGPDALERIEAEAEALNETLTPLTSFILPGGSMAAAQAHLARTVIRRAERRAVELAAVEAMNPLVARTLNRLSDLLFVVGRGLNDGGRRDLLWVPGGVAPQPIPWTTS